MKLVAKTSHKLIFESSLEEYEKKGFDILWDEIRSLYPEPDYELFNFEQKDKVFFELTKKQIF